MGRLVRRWRGRVIVQSLKPCRRNLTSTLSMISNPAPLSAFLRNTMRTNFLRLLAITFVITQVVTRAAGAQQVPDVSELALPGGPVQTDSRPQIFGAGGDIQVAVKLADPSLAQAHGKGAKRSEEHTSELQS